MKTTMLNALPEHIGQRIDLFVSERMPELSRNAVQRLCGEGRILVDGRVSEKNLRLKGGELVAVEIPQPRHIELPAQEIPLDVAYEDESIIVVNKRQGMVVHPAPGNEDGTLVNALLHHCGSELSGIGGERRPGIVHRLDKMTSGLLVVAKTAQAHEGLAAQIKAREVSRVYEAVVYGRLEREEGRIEAPIGRHPTDRKKMSVNAKNGREAATAFWVLAEYPGFTHLRLKLETGRTHQIRVHMASTGHPVAGDRVYGPKKAISSLEGQCLHAKTLGFYHPVTKRYLEITSELPDYFTRFLKSLART